MSGLGLFDAGVRDDSERIADLKQEIGLRIGHMAGSKRDSGVGTGPSTAGLRQIVVNYENSRATAPFEAGGAS